MRWMRLANVLGSSREKPDASRAVSNSRMIRSLTVLSLLSASERSFSTCKDVHMTHHNRIDEHCGCPYDITSRLVCAVDIHSTHHEQTDVRCSGRTVATSPVALLWVGMGAMERRAINAVHRPPAPGNRWLIDNNACKLHLCCTSPSWSLHFVLSQFPASISCSRLLYFQSGNLCVTFTQKGLHRGAQENLIVHRFH